MPGADHAAGFVVQGTIDGDEVGFPEHLIERDGLRAALAENFPAVIYREPAFTYTGDNAAMIAAAGYFRARTKKFTPWERLRADANWELPK